MVFWNALFIIANLYLLCVSNFLSINIFVFCNWFTFVNNKLGLKNIVYQKALKTTFYNWFK
jgi:hypothetical protein